MVRPSSPKLYRKVLILCVLLTSLFALSSARPTAANPCCVACAATYGSCTEICYGLSSDPAMIACLLACAGDYDNCSRACGGGLPVCPPV